MSELQERRRVALKLVTVTDAYFGAIISRGWFFSLFREVCPHVITDYLEPV